MAAEEKDRTAELNSRLWGARAEDWAGIQEGTCRPVFVGVFDRIGLDGDTDYLDAGCGAGMAAQIASERGARVSGLDAAESLLGIARARVPGGEFRVGELESLPFPDDSFDVVTGFNAFQYAGNPRAALAEAKRVARQDAVVVIVTWGEPQGMEAASLVAALKPLLPPPPPGAPGPFALSNESTLRDFAASAGLTPGGVFDVSEPWHYPDLDTALRGLKSAGVAVRAIEHSSEAAVDAAYSKSLEPFRQSDGTYRVGATFRCLVARVESS
jgi:SAM-dependent methyltransferase